MNKLILALLVVLVINCNAQETMNLKVGIGSKSTPTWAKMQYSSSVIVENSMFVFNGSYWGTQASSESKIALKVFSDNIVKQHVCIMNISMSDESFKMLKEFVGSLPNICTTGGSMSRISGEKGWKLSMFDVRWCNDSKDYIPVNPDVLVDIDYLKAEIRNKFFK